MEQGETALIVDVADADDGERVDRVLARHLPAMSRTRIQALVRAGRVRTGQRTIAEPGQRVKRGETIHVRVPPSRPAEPVAERMPLAIVHEDASLVVLDKPAGLVVHPAAGHGSGTLVNALIAHCGASLSGIGGVRRPGIVHRLDKDTSGLLVVAKTDAAHRGLAAQFEAHGRDGRLERAYLALAWGVPTRPRGVIDAKLARSTANRTKIKVVKAGGREAVTHFEVLETFPMSDGRPLASLVRLRLETGRTHQIRVHLAHLGHPLLGDPVYGLGFLSSATRLTTAAQALLNALARQALHAAVLGFEHPVTRRPLRFESALPDDMADLVAALRSGAGAPKAGPAAAKQPTRRGAAARQRALK